MKDFGKLSQKFNTSFSEELSGSANTVEKIENEISIFKSKKNELVKEGSEVKTLEDKTWLQNQIKIVIEHGQLALDSVKKDIKIGTTPRTIEVYAKLMQSTLEGLKELATLNRTIADMEFYRNPETEPSTKINIQMDGKELFDYMDKVRKESQLNAIDAEFDVEDTPEDKGK